MAAVNERLGAMRERAGQAYEDARYRVSDSAQQAGDMVRQHPASSSMVTFGLGFGLGLLLVLAMPGHREPTWRERHHLTRDDLNDALSRILPNNLRRRAL